MSELVTMYPAQANSPETSLSGALTAAGTAGNVVDGSVLPEAPNLLTIGADGSTAETVLMTAKNGNVLTVTRAQNGTTARAWSAGDVIARYFTAADQTAMQENIKKLNGILVACSLSVRCQARSKQQFVAFINSHSYIGIADIYRQKHINHHLALYLFFIQKSITSI